MSPWIVFTGVGLFLDIPNILRALLSMAIVDAIFGILGWVIGAYFFLVVLSFKKEIEAGVGQGEVVKA